MNYRYFIILWILALNYFPCKAQEERTQPEYRNFPCAAAIPGCYKSFSDFRSGNPVIKSKFHLEKRNPHEKHFASASGYRLIFEEGCTPANVSLNSIWGVYDNDTLYINREFYIGKKGFDKICCMGSYGYFHGINPNTETSTDLNNVYLSSFLFGVVGAAIVDAAATGGQNQGGKFPHITIYLVDMATGMVSPLTSFKLEKILEDDQEMLELYNKEQHKSSMMVMHAYLDTFVERKKNW